MAINAPKSVPASERLSRREYAQQIHELELEKEAYDEVDFNKSGMTIEKFKASERYKHFANQYKHQAQYVKSNIEHRLPLSNEERQLFGQLLDDYIVAAFDDSESKFKHFSDEQLKKHVYTGMRRQFHGFAETLDDVRDLVSMDDILRATILFLPERGKNPAWLEFCMEQAFYVLKAAQEHALELPRHQASAAARSPLFYAVVHDKFDTAHDLLRVKDRSLSAEEYDSHGRNILQIAALKGQAELAEELAAMRIPRFNPAATDNYGNHALHLAVKSGSLETVKAMQKAVGDNVLAANNKGKTPLHLAVEMKINEMLDALTDSKDTPEIDAQDLNGNTAVHIAANMNNPAAVMMLVNAGANTKLVNHADQSLHALLMNVQGGGVKASG